MNVPTFGEDFQFSDIEQTNPSGTYTELTFRLSQSGTSAPNIAVMNNSTTEKVGFTPSRDSAGVYNITSFTSAAPFEGNPAISFAVQTSGNDALGAKIDVDTTNALIISTYTVSGDPGTFDAADLDGSMTVTVRIYA